MSDDEIATYLCYKGYTIKKENLSLKEKKKINRQQKIDQL